MINVEKELAGAYALEKTERGVGVRLVAGETWAYFSGHFPKMPILPAVAIVDISHYFLCRLQDNADLQISKVNGLRLKQPIHARDSIYFRLEQESEKTFYVVWKNADNKTMAEVSLEVF